MMKNNGHFREDSLHGYVKILTTEDSKNQKNSQPCGIAIARP